MKSTLLSSLIVASLSAKAAWAVAEWGQCGGTGYTGSTTCDAGLTCVYQNDFYYQCLKTTGATTTTTKITTTTTKATTTTTTSGSTSSSGAKGTPIGFAAGTTGGAGGVTVTPTTTAELLGYLSDSTKRIIVLTKIFDYTSYYGTTAGKACKLWTCTNGQNPQMTIDNSTGQCAGQTLYDATYYNSGASKALVVNSNKTIIGKGSSAGIKGIGLSLVNVSNVIIQNIQITDLNPQYVWGGDAINLAGATKVWIDHNYIARIGRQFIVSHYDPNTGITISNNYFDGRTSWSPSCNGHHYWAFLFLGEADQLTMVQNHIYYTAGRGPHIGGYTGAYKQQLHLVNNYYDSVDGHAIDAGANSWVLAEGNYFKAVNQPDTGSSAGGTEYFVQTVAEAGVCSSYMGRVCEWNRMDSATGAVATRATTSVLSDVGSLSAVKGLKPMGVADVPAYVLANRGVGIVN
ncbi:polysaccharide lyase family 1 protein [Tulasnella calospora MUT 4182]|uniref:pectin lyase n=1 Tax=Tulasnella calospora MUT 4182 TaxID=1051891 RepID=A0A0C3M4K7_9AGAM|nr:polysaccharide lyase family 1 protein [Tulasnella calospora MUT 4182]